MEELQEALEHPVINPRRLLFIIIITWQKEVDAVIVTVLNDQNEAREAVQKAGCRIISLSDLVQFGKNGK